MTEAGKAFSLLKIAPYDKNLKRRIFTVKAVTFDKVLQVATDYPVPAPADGEALLQVRFAGLCATDLEITKGYMGFTGVLGHEFTATVIECESDQGLVGKRVTGEINIGCNKCGWCRRGLANHCPSRSVLGILNKDGAMAEFLTLPAKNLHIIPDSVSDEAATLTEPLAAAFQITKEHRITPTDTVCVLGGGRLGALAALAVKETGCELIVGGRNLEKNKIIDNLGIDTTLPKDLKDTFDFVVDCTGSTDSLNHAIRLTKPKGTIILKTTVATPTPIDLNNIVINELKISGSRCGPFKLALDFLDKEYTGVNTGSSRIDSLISAIHPIEEAATAFKEAASKRAIMKILLRVGAEG